MEIYLVGGAVRDQLLGLPVTERDWVVVGASEAEMKKLGYRSVGKDFPVFLHPDTSEEYALARTERKTGKGHTGFECATDSVTLEDDLKRRDLTINAIAMDPDGKLVDPWRGRHDLDHQILRHVSAAFEEDPLRVLRVARFAARFHALGFKVHPSTSALMRRMVTRGDMSELTPERVWLEFEKALATDHPEIFFKLLEQVGAGHILWPEITQAGIHNLTAMTRKSLDPRFRFAALLGHLSPDQVQVIGRRLRAPNRLTEFARIASTHYDAWHQGAGLGPEGTVDLLYAADAFRQPDRFRDLNGFYELANGGPDADLTAAYWLNCLEIAAAVTASDVDPSLTGKDIGDAIRAEQVRQIQVNSEDD